MIITIVRLSNYGLMLISPVLLVRLLTVEQFGAYREFLLYASIAASIAAFNININLMYFIPAHPERAWRYVAQSTVLVAVASLTIIALMVLIDLLLGGTLVGRFLVPLSIFTLCFVNIDFWEQLWLAQKQTALVWFYTATRLILRVLVVVVAAALSADVDTIVWAVVALEAVRLVASAIAWGVMRGDPGPPWEGSWREQVQAALPLGISLLLITVTRNAGSFLVTKMMGAAALAQYTIGTFAAPLIVFRSAFSDALLPDMARDPSNTERMLQLWRRATVVLIIGFVPLTVLLVRFAEPLVVTLFSPAYQPAVPVFQIYAVVLLRECFDFGVLVRALNRNQLLVSTNALAAVLNLGLSLLLIPAFGLVGAITAMLVARIFDAAYLLWRISVASGVTMRSILPWSSTLKVMIAAGVAAPILLGSWWTAHGGALGALTGMAVASILYFAAVILLLYRSRMPEALFLAEWLQARIGRRKLLT